MLALVLVPAQLAQGPSQAWGATEGAAVPFQSVSPVALVVIGVTLATLAGAYLRHRHRAG